MVKKIRKIGDVLLDLEVYLEEMVDHGLQHGDVLALVKVWLDVHAPGSREEYDAGGSPVFTYGPGFEKVKK